MHHSGNDDYPVRGFSDFLEDLDNANEPIQLQKLQIEAIIQLADAIGYVAKAINGLGSADAPFYSSVEAVERE